MQKVQDNLSFLDKYEEEDTITTTPMQEDNLSFLDKYEQEEDIQTKPEEDDALSFLDKYEEDAKPPEETSLVLNPEYAEETKVDRVKTLDEFSKDENFLATLRSYGKKRFGDSGLQMEDESNKDYVRRFITHYRQFNANTLDLASQVDWVRNASDNDKAEFGALYRDIQRLPNFYEKGGDRALSALTDYAVSFLSDPLTVIGFGSAKVASLGAAKLAQKALLDVGKKGALEQSRRIGFQAVKKPLLVEAGVEGLRCHCR